MWMNAIRTNQRATKITEMIQGGNGRSNVSPISTLSKPAGSIVNSISTLGKYAGSIANLILSLGEPLRNMVNLISTLRQVVSVIAPGISTVV